MKRKTISVEQIREMLNMHIAVSPTTNNIEAWKERRIGIANALATILHKTGNYRGFGYLDAPYVPGETDETRVHYY